MSGHLAIVGIGPGALEHMTPAARRAIEQADVIIGYYTYLNLIGDVAPTVPRIGTGMRREVDRVRRAIALCDSGKRVALISGGDAGVYGMAGLVFEVMWEQGRSLAVTVYPGITAANAAAALLGAPLSGDYAVVSLSDHLVPLEDLLARIEAATRAGFVLCVYNPRARRRAQPFDAAYARISQILPPDTPVGLVRSAYRHGQEIRILPLRDLPLAHVDMATMIIIGNLHTVAHNGRMVTRRGYQSKYRLSSSNS